MCKTLSHHGHAVLVGKIAYLYLIGSDWFWYQGSQSHVLKPDIFLLPSTIILSGPPINECYYQYMASKWPAWIQVALNLMEGDVCTWVLPHLEVIQGG